MVPLIQDVNMPMWEYINTFGTLLTEEILNLVFYEKKKNYSASFNMAMAV